MIAYQKENNVRAAAVIGGGLLGLEAAKAMYDLGMETHVIEYAPILMCRQVSVTKLCLRQRSLMSVPGMILLHLSVAIACSVLSSPALFCHRLFCSVIACSVTVD